MNVITTAGSIRKAMISAAAVCLMTLPVIASASLLNSSTGADGSYDSSSYDSAESQERLYEALKNESRNTCGPTSVSVAGSVERAMDNKKCFQETLTVAVQRVDNPGVSKLHQQ